MNKFYQKYKQLPLQGRATICYTICNILQRGISYLTTLIYTRIMTTEQYGSYSVFLAWLEIFEIIATFRLAWGGFVVGLEKYEKDRDSYCSAMHSLSFTITSIALVSYLLLAKWINQLTDMTTPMTLLIFALLYVLPAIQFWTVRRRVEYRYTAVLLVTVISSLLMPALGVVAAMLSTEKVLAVIGSRVFVQGIIGIVLIILCYRNKFTFYHKEYWKRALIFNVPLLPHYLSTVALHSSDRIIIKSLEGKHEAAIYSVAYSLSMAMQLFGSSISQSLQPWLFKKLKEKSYDGIAKIINLSLIIVAALNLLLIALAPEAIAIMAPKAYQEAIWIIPPLAATVVVMFFYQHFVNVEFYFEESKITSFASIGAAVLNIALNYLLIPVFGYLAAGYTTLISYMVFAVIHYIFMRIVCRKNQCSDSIFDIKKMLLIMLVFGGITAVMAVGDKITWIRYATLLCMIIVAIYNRKSLIAFVKQFMKKK